MSTNLIFSLQDALSVLTQAHIHKTPLTSIPIIRIDDWDDVPSGYEQTHLGLTLNADKIINLDAADAESALIQILAHAPLANASLQLLLDRAFDMAEQDAELRNSIATLFTDNHFPDRNQDADISDGSLAYSMLEHMRDKALATLYIKLIRMARAQHTDLLTYLSLDKTMAHSPCILDGDINVILTGDHGHMILKDMLYQAFRIDTPNAKDATQNRIDHGRQAALTLAFETDNDVIEAWIKADSFQARLCHDMHATLTLYSGKRPPDWVRSDMFRVLEREAMKQIFAERLSGHFDDINKKLVPAIQTSAKGDVHPSLQKAAGEILDNNDRYTGTLQQFAAEADARSRV